VTFDGTLSFEAAAAALIVEIRLRDLLRDPETAAANTRGRRRSAVKNEQARRTGAPYAHQ